MRWPRRLVGGDAGEGQAFRRHLRIRGPFDRYLLPSILLCPAAPTRPGDVLPNTRAARQAGFRPCRRCRPEETVIQDPQVRRVQRLCRHIEKYDSPNQPLTLVAMSEHVNVSPHHLQRTFKRIMGISPRQYAEACRVRRLKALFKRGEKITSALYRRPDTVPAAGFTKGHPSAWG